jgi:hypothetical protein
VAFIAPPDGNLEKLRIENCLLLRSDLHRLLDQNLIGIHPVSKKVRVAPGVSTFDFWELTGKTMRLPASAPDSPNPEVLKARWKKFSRKAAKVRKQLESQHTRPL